MLKGVIPATGACLLILALWLASHSERTDPVEASAASSKIGHDTATARASTRSARREMVSTNADEAVLALLRSPEATGKQLALEALLPDLIEKDLDKAAEVVGKLEPWASADDAIRTLLGTWATRDPHSAATWCCEHVDDAERNRWLAYVCNKAAASNPGEAMRLAEKHGIAMDTNVSGQVLHYWARSDLPAARRWIERETDTEFRDHSWRSLVMSLSESNPGSAATLAAEQISSESIQEEAVISVLHQWILKDRNAAAAWVKLFPEGPLRERAEGELELHSLN